MTYHLQYLSKGYQRWLSFLVVIPRKWKNTLRTKSSKRSQDDEITDSNDPIPDSSFRQKTLKKILKEVHRFTRCSFSPPFRSKYIHNPFKLLSYWRRVPSINIMSFSPRISSFSSSPYSFDRIGFLHLFACPLWSIYFLFHLDAIGRRKEKEKIWRSKEMR